MDMTNVSFVSQLSQGGQAHTHLQAINWRKTRTDPTNNVLLRLDNVSLFQMFEPIHQPEHTHIQCLLTVGLAGWAVYC